MHNGFFHQSLLVTGRTAVVNVARMSRDHDLGGHMSGWNQPGLLVVSGTK